MTDRSETPGTGGDGQAVDSGAGRPGRAARIQAAVIVALRFLIVPAWIVAAGYVLSHATTGQSGGPGVISLVPPDAPAAKVAAREARLFPVPFLAEAAVVQAARHGLSPQAQALSVAYALHTDAKALLHPKTAQMLAIPIPNTLGIVPGSRTSGGAIITYLEYPTSVSAESVTNRSKQYARALDRHAGGVAGVTGIVPAEWHEGLLIQGNLRLVELATAAIIAVLVGLRFRSVGASLLTLVTVGIANLSADQALAWLERYGHIPVSGFVQPLQIALVLGIGTDYCVFYLSSVQPLMRAGRVEAARRAAAETTPIVTVGALVLAASLASLEVAPLAFLRNLGPSLSVTVAATYVVVATFVPAALGLLGWVVFWPGGRPRTAAGARRRSTGVSRFLTRRLGSLLVLALSLAALGFCASRALHLGVGFSEVVGLPAGSQERDAYDALSRNFAPGMLGPTTILVSGPDAVPGNPHLIQLQHELEHQHGVAGVLGPADQPIDQRLGLVYAPHADTARYIVVLNTDPFGVAGIHDLDAIRSALPGMVARAGVRQPTIGVTGDTALAAETTAAMRGSLLLVVPVVLLVNMVLLGIYLRAVLAPILLVLSSALSVVAAIGITTWLFSDALGYGELTYYVPYASAILLISLASDYNAFVSGRIWTEAETRPIRQAIAVAAPRASRAVRTAGVILAGSFGAIALIPVLGFREFAFTMAIGVLLETFVVRSLIVPTVLSLFGSWAQWPHGAIAPAPPPTEAPAPG